VGMESKVTFVLPASVAIWDEELKCIDMNKKLKGHLFLMPLYTLLTIMIIEMVLNYREMKPLIIVLLLHALVALTVQGILLLND